MAVGLPGILIAIAVLTSAAWGQQPFYTDDPSTTDKGRFHFEFFDEFDSLQPEQFPNHQQNTASYKLNFGLTNDLELDIDNPYLAILRARIASPHQYIGIGDTNMGLKWAFEKEHGRVPAMSVTFYVEVPTGDTRQSLGSGLTDYWLYGIAQKSITDRTKVTANLGVLFAGNTSVGVIGIQTARGKVYTGALSLTHKRTERISYGVEVTGALTNKLELGRGQMQFLAGVIYQWRESIGFTAAALGGRFVASPVVGGQLGFTIDFPKFGRKAPGR